MDDTHRFPFSLLSSARSSSSECVKEQSGGVYENVFDKKIGRSVLQVKGAVSANNYIVYSNLHLTGKFLYVMLQLHKNDVATFHLEIETNENYSLRITISTLYQSIRFLGRSLRIPLPTCPRWMILEADLETLLSRHCSTASVTPTLKYIKVIILLFFQSLQ